MTGTDTGWVLTPLEDGWCAGVTYDKNGIDDAMAKVLNDSSLAAEVPDLPLYVPALATWLKASL